MTYPLLPGAGRIPPVVGDGLAGLPAWVVVSRPCACGTRIRASRHDPAPGVAAHNRTPAHRAWWERVRGDWQGE